MGSLRFELSPVRPAYESGEAILVRLLLENRGDEPVTVNRRLALKDQTDEGEVALQVTDPRAGLVPVIARINLGRPGRDDFVELRPFAIVGRVVDLAPYYQLHLPGSYELRGSYTGGPGGPLESPLVRFVLNQTSSR